MVASGEHRGKALGCFIARRVGELYANASSSHFDPLPHASPQRSPAPPWQPPFALTSTALKCCLRQPVPPPERAPAQPHTSTLLEAAPSLLRAMAATNKRLAQSNKPRTGAKATKRRREHLI